MGIGADEPEAVLIQSTSPSKVFPAGLSQGSFNLACWTSCLQNRDYVTVAIEAEVHAQE
jgi:hypothetical protein